MRASSALAARRPNVFVRLYRDIARHPALYLMFLPVLAFYLLFCYKPMYGVLIAFKNYRPARGIWGSPWVGPEYFVQFFESAFCYRLIRNTLLINLYSLLFAFPTPILLAVMLNEVKNAPFRRTVQTISYLPHFISTVVIVGIVKTLFSYNGAFTDIFVALGMPRVSMIAQPQYFRSLFVASGIWQSIGWDSIIYLAAVGNIDTELYEAAALDGAGRLKRIWHVTLPGILPTINIMLILRIGSMMSIGHEKVILMYSPNTYETGDVISSYVYRMGLENGSFSYSTAVGLFNSLVNLILVVLANTFSRKLTETSLW